MLDYVGMPQFPPHWENSVNALKHPALHAQAALRQADETGVPLTGTELRRTAGIVRRLFDALEATLGDAPTADAVPTEPLPEKT